MQPSSQPAGPAALIRSWRGKLLIAVLSVATLAAGVLLRPRTESGPLTPPKEHSAPLLEEEAQRRTPAGVFTALQDLGARVVGFTVAIPAAPATRRGPLLDFATPPASPAAPAGYGVVVSTDGVVLTHAAALDGRSTLPVQIADGSSAHARLVAFEPATDLALIQLPSSAPVHASSIAREGVQAGAFAAGGGRWNGADTVLPVFITRIDGAGLQFTAGGASLAAGTPLFSRDAELFAIAAGPAHPGRAFPARQSLERLQAAVAGGTAQPASLGIVLQPMTPALADAFGAPGALISDVVPGSAAAAAGIQPGDVLVAVGGTPVDSAEAAQRGIAQLRAGAHAPLRLVRNREQQTVNVTAAEAFDVAALLRHSPRPAADAPEARHLLTDDQLRASGIDPTAHVLAIDLRPVQDRDDAVRALRRAGQAAILYLEHGGARQFAIVQAKP